MSFMEWGCKEAQVTHQETYTSKESNLNDQNYHTGKRTIFARSAFYPRMKFPNRGSTPPRYQGPKKSPPKSLVFHYLW
eukprot:4608590-Amphidinium_carterae.1